MSEKLILASGSAIRAKILNDAGLDFDIIKPDVDEAEIKTSCTEEGLSNKEIAAQLADAKALAVAAPDNAFVLGSDQIMEHDGVLYDKPVDLREAAKRLKLLQNSVHSLINAVSIAQNGRIVYRNLDAAHLHMRPMSDDEISAYIEMAGPAVLSSVGAYQVERLGARLFNRIDGDFFTVLGLSLFPALKFFRDADILDF